MNFFFFFAHATDIFYTFFFHRDPADKLIRHRACSLRDNAYALIKAELDSDFEDKCREISKTRRILESNYYDNEEENKNAKIESTSTSERAEKKDSLNSSHSLVVNGKKFGTARKRKIPAWARGYVKKVQKKKKIAFDENVTEMTSKSSNETTTSIDLDKFQEFETEANSVLNGHVGLFDNTDSENDSQNENSKDTQGNQNDTMDQLQVDNQDHIDTEEDKLGAVGNGDSNSSSRRESIDELSFAIESDSSRDKIEESEKVIIDRTELENAWHFTVEATKDFPVEVLCDIYVQLSRCVGRYAHCYNRKSLPKVIFLFTFIVHIMIEKYRLHIFN